MAAVAAGPTRTRRTLAAVAIAGATLLVGGCMGSDEPASRAPAASVEGRPNVVLIVTDDQEAPSITSMPAVQELLADRGASFDRFYTSYPLCCPSRTTLWTGQYAHNHGVSGNFPDTDGGGYVSLIDPERVLPEWLRRSGYKTAHVGKWASVPGKVPPEGWSRWIGIAQESSARYYDYRLFDSKLDDGVPYGSKDGDYHSDVMTRRVTRLMDAYERSDRPWFISLAYLAPHVGFGRPDDAATKRCNPGGKPEGPVPAPRDADDFEDAELPDTPAFDEKDVSDKTGDQPPRLDGRRLRDLRLEYRCRLASLSAVDDGVRSIIEKLDALGELDNTYVIFTSDNGFMLGEHRIPARKNLPYEESIRVPLIIRGPGIEPGSTIADPAVNVDLASTILDVTGASQPGGIERPADGISLRSLLEGEASPVPNRAVLIEGRYDTSEEDGQFVVASYEGVRTERYELIRKYETTVPIFAEGAEVPLGSGDVVGTELYDMKRDPFQLESVAGTKAYADVEAALIETLAKLAECEGRSCRVRANPAAP
ncbi:sulfatase [soil metagenome]